jgi:hypothetical protein
MVDFFLFYFFCWVVEIINSLILFKSRTGSADGILAVANLFRKRGVINANARSGFEAFGISGFHGERGDAEAFEAHAIVEIELFVIRRFSERTHFSGI